jgi:solute carrier family 25 phosphate transporter 3
MLPRFAQLVSWCQTPVLTEMKSHHLPSKDEDSVSHQNVRISATRHGAVLGNGAFILRPSALVALSADENPTLVTYLKFALAGAVCCSATHSAAVPIDVIKTRLQLSDKYHGISHAARTIVKEEGALALLTGLSPTAVGYFLQGWFKFGLYEYFKRLYASMAGPERAEKGRFGIWLAAGGTAEFFADLALCPLEATRIRLVSQPSFAKSLPEAFGKLLANEGIRGLYAGLFPILLKQIPYTMAKFAVFETASEMIYRALESAGKPKAEIRDSTKLLISLNSGIFAGICAAVVSQPADTVLSVINKTKVTGSVAEATFRIIRELGPRGLFRGLGARAIMVGSLTAGQFFIYDGLKQLLGVAPVHKEAVPLVTATAPSSSVTARAQQSQ